jgi:hypothetical protein
MNIQEVINIASKFDAKGFKQAETASQKLGRTVKNLAGTLGLAFGTTAIVAYGKASVKVALQAQAEQERLNNILRVTTGATLAQIDVLNQQADALERIGVVSAGNIKTTQSQLATFDLQISTIKALTPAILDYVTAEKGATATAADFKAMTNGLAQALNGNFTSLTRTGFVLDEVTKKMIKEGTETERVTALVKVLNSTYKDFNANLRATDSGQMQVLANTAQEVQTIIGTGIIDALKLLSNDKTIENLSTDMRDFANAVSDTLMGISLFVNELKNIPLIGKALGNIFDNIGSGIIFTQMGREQRERLAYNPNEHRARQQAVKLDRDAARLAKTNNQLKKIDNDNTSRKIVLTGDQLALLELEKKFDVERIGLYAALNASTDSETKMRLLSLIAIHDQNEAMAGMIKKANEAEDAFAALVEALRSTIRSMLDSIKPQILQLQKLIGQSQSTFGSQADTPKEVMREVVREKLDIAMPDILALQNHLAKLNVPGYSRTSMETPNVTVNVTGSVTTERDLVAAITQGLYAQQASGTPVTYSTVY